MLSCLTGGILTTKRPANGIMCFALCALGCDPGIDVVGSVSDDAGNPIANASVEVVCAKLLGFVKPARTDASGGFATPEGLGCLPKSCVVRVSAPDGRQLEMPVGPNCIETVFACDATSQCNRVGLSVRLPSVKRQ